MGGYSSETYFFRGEYRTVREIAKHSKGISIDTIRQRLRSGWDAEQAIIPNQNGETIAKEWQGKDLLVTFPRTLDGIIPSMQPQLNKPYIARRNHQIGNKPAFKCFYFIQLENGKPLIVYPSDFEILGEAPV